MFYMSMFCIIWDILYIINKCQHFKHTRNSSNSTILINWFLKTFFKCLSLFCELSLEDHIVKNQISFVYLFLLIIQSTSKEKTIYFISRTKRFTKYVQGRPAVTRWPVEPKQNKFHIKNDHGWEHELEVKVVPMDGHAIQNTNRKMPTDRHIELNLLKVM